MKALADPLIRFARRRLGSEEESFLSILMAAPYVFIVIGLVSLFDWGDPILLAWFGIWGVGALLLRGRSREETLLLYWSLSWICAITGAIVAVAAALDLALGRDEAGGDHSALVVAAIGTGLALANVMIAQIYHRLARVAGGR